MSDTSLIKAAQAGDQEAVIRIFIEAAGELDSATLTAALNAGAFNGHLEVVKTMLQHGADVNARAQNDMTALNCAIENLHTDLVKFLLENGADVNAQDESGTSPLHEAVDVEAECAKRQYDDGNLDAAPRIQVTDLLIAAGANVNSRDKKGRTPLGWAMGQAHKAAENLLREHGGTL